MPYLDIPLPNDQLSQSQSDIRNNFLALSPFGNHWALFDVLGADPATAANQLAIYAKNSTLSGAPELFIRHASNGAVTEFTSALAAVTGWTRLPSGILLKWGSDQINASGLTTTNFPVAPTIPPFSNVFTAFVTPRNQNGTDQNNYISVNQLNILSLIVLASSRSYGAGSPATFYPYAYNYLVIGI